jgi:hypothetical protein
MPETWQYDDKSWERTLMHNYITYSQSLWVSRMDKAILRGFSLFIFLFFLIIIFIYAQLYHRLPERPVGDTYGQGYCPGVFPFNFNFFIFFIFRHLRPEFCGRVTDGQGYRPVSPGSFFSLFPISFAFLLTPALSQARRTTSHHGSRTKPRSRKLLKN